MLYPFRKLLANKNRSRTGKLRKLEDVDTELASFGIGAQHASTRPGSARNPRPNYAYISKPKFSRHIPPGLTRQYEDLIEVRQTVIKVTSDAVSGGSSSR